MENVGPILPNTRILTHHLHRALALRRSRSFVVGRLERSRWTLSANSSSSVRISFRLALRRCRSRARRASRPTSPPTRRHSAATRRTTASASRTIQGQLTAAVYPRKPSYSGRVSRIASFSPRSAPSRSPRPDSRTPQERTLTFTTGPISVPAFSVVQAPMAAQSPAVDGYVVGMNAEVVDAAGRVQGRDRVMLHHIVFAKVGTPDYTCGGFTQRFFAEGEERMALSLPQRLRLREQGQPTAGRSSTC